MRGPGDFCARHQRRGFRIQLGPVNYDTAKMICHARMPDSDLDEVTMAAVAKMKALPRHLGKTQTQLAALEVKK